MGEFARVVRALKNGGLHIVVNVADNRLAKLVGTFSKSFIEVLPNNGIELCIPHIDCATITPMEFDIDCSTVSFGVFHK